MGEFVGDEEAVFFRGPVPGCVLVERCLAAAWGIIRCRERMLPGPIITRTVVIPDLPVLVKRPVLRILWLVDLGFQKFQPVLHMSRQVFWNTLPADDPRPGPGLLKPSPLVWPLARTLGGP